MHGFLRVTLYVSLAPLFFAVLGEALGAMGLLDPMIAHHAVAKGLAARTALAGVVTSIVAFGVAGYGGFRTHWPRAAVPLALSIASYLAATSIL